MRYPDWSDYIWKHEIWTQTKNWLWPYKTNFQKYLSSIISNMKCVSTYYYGDPVAMGSNYCDFPMTLQWSFFLRRCFDCFPMFSLVYGWSERQETISSEVVPYCQRTTFTSLWPVPMYLDAPICGGWIMQEGKQPCIARCASARHPDKLSVWQKSRAHSSYNYACAC